MNEKKVRKMSLEHGTCTEISNQQLFFMQLKFPYCPSNFWRKKKIFLDNIYYFM